MSNKRKNSWIALLLVTVFLSFLACERMEHQFPTAIDNTIKNQTKTSNSLNSFLSVTPDIIVNSTADVLDFSVPMQVEQLPGPDGLVTLYEALVAANYTPGPQIIGFNIPTSDPGFDGKVFVIQPTKFLPGLEDAGITINGATQAEFSGDTNPDGPEIVLDGSLLEPYGGGLSIMSAENNIHHLVINNFPGSAIVIMHHATSNVITGCYIGVDPTGQNKVGNLWDGVLIHGSNNQIGGYSEEEKNIISGNGRDGIQMGGSTNYIIGNFIGTDVSGTKSIANDESGIALIEGNNNKLIENLISGNLWDGVQLWAADNTVLQGNIIGADINGNPTLGNAAFGIRMTPNSTGNHVNGNIVADNRVAGILIGDADSPANSNIVKGNTIFNNNNGGIFVINQSYGITISQNSIYSNDGLGIDLDWNGVTENDPGDEDSGTNNLMNFPVLTWAHAAPGKLVVKGTIDTSNPETVTIEFFANPVPIPGGDPSGHGEGAIYLGSKKPNPQGKFTATLSPVAVGTLITATATDANGNTSEFAANIEAVFP